MGTSSVLTESAAGEIRERLATLKAEHTKAAIALCELLFDVYYNSVQTSGGEVELWKWLGFESFDHFAESEAELHHGTGLAYVLIWDELYHRRQFEKDILPNSITKLKELARVSRKHRGNMKEMLRWVSKARSMTCCEFQNEVDGEFGTRGRRRTLGFYMKWNRAREVMKAISAAKEEFSVSTNGEALAALVERYTELAKLPAAKRLLRAAS